MSDVIMLNKTIRPTRITESAAAKIMKMTSSCDKESDAYSYAWSVFSLAIRQGRVDPEEVEMLRFNGDTEELPEYPSTRTVAISVENWETVYNFFKENHPDARRLKFSYMMKIAMFYTCDHLDAVSSKQQSAEKIDRVPDTAEYREASHDGVELMAKAAQKTAQLIRSGRIEEIMKYLEV